MTAATDVLVSTDWVADHLADDGVAIVEVDEDTTRYEADGHIPGAIAIHWRDELQHPVRRSFLDKEAFEELVDRKGIARDDHVVLYGGNHNWFAAYAYWYFRLYGHPHVSLMDGGRKAWEDEGRDLEREPVSRPSRSGYQASPPDAEIRAVRQQILDQFVGAPAGTALVDVRSPAEYKGEVTAPEHLPQEAAQVPGHIPGAANIPWSQAVDTDTGRFKPVAELQELYAGHGVAPDQEVVAYCRIGERSAHTWFVLHELLGFARVRNYDGSWTEYGSLVDVPVER